MFAGKANHNNKEGAEESKEQLEDKGTAVATLTAAAAASTGDMGSSSSSGNNNNNNNDNKININDPGTLTCKYRAKAKWVHLEAECMDAQLTLEKIAKLKKAICHSQDMLLLKEQ